MGTRSTIALEFADGTVEQVYCHWDGYLNYNGAILEKHYKDPFKLQLLIEQGDMSSLGKEVGTQHAFGVGVKHDEVDGFAVECTFYKRDRNESGTGAKRFKDFQEYQREHQYEEYEYILRNVNGVATWFVCMYGTDGEYLTMADAVEFRNAKETA
jgi:hypothetical protein